MGGSGSEKIRAEGNRFAKRFVEHFRTYVEEGKNCGDAVHAACERWQRMLDTHHKYVLELAENDDSLEGIQEMKTIIMVTERDILSCLNRINTTQSPEIEQANQMHAILVPAYEKYKGLSVKLVERLACQLMKILTGKTNTQQKEFFMEQINKPFELVKQYDFPAQYASGVHVSNMEKTMETYLQWRVCYNVKNWRKKTLDARLRLTMQNLNTKTVSKLLQSIWDILQSISTYRDWRENIEACKMKVKRKEMSISEPEARPVETSHADELAQPCESEEKSEKRSPEKTQDESGAETPINGSQTAIAVWDPEGVDASHKRSYDGWTPPFPLRTWSCRELTGWAVHTLNTSCAKRMRKFEVSGVKFDEATDEDLKEWHLSKNKRYITGFKRTNTILEIRDIMRSRDQK